MVRLHPNSPAIRFDPQPSSASRSITATSSGVSIRSSPAVIAGEREVSCPNISPPSSKGVSFHVARRPVCRVTDIVGAGPGDSDFFDDFGPSLHPGWAIDNPDAYRWTLHGNYLVLVLKVEVNEFVIGNVRNLYKLNVRIVFTVPFNGTLLPLFIVCGNIFISYLE